MWSVAVGVWSVAVGVESSASGCVVGLMEGRPLCTRAGLGRVFPRCCNTGPSVSKGTVGRSTEDHDTDVCTISVCRTTHLNLQIHPQGRADELASSSSL